jgi:hypothetical protein
MRRDSPWNKPSWTCKLPQTGHWLRSALRQGAWGLDDSAQECVWGEILGICRVAILGTEAIFRFRSTGLPSSHGVCFSSSCQCLPRQKCRGPRRQARFQSRSRPHVARNSTTYRLSYSESRCTAKIVFSAQSLPKTATLVRGSQPQISIDFYFRRITTFVRLPVIDGVAINEHVCED